MLSELFDLLLSPIAFLLARKRATPEQIRRFYRSVEWKRARYETLRRSPRCAICGRLARDGARMNVDHIKPLSRRWDLRLAPGNLQTACASCNWGKGGRA
jgi:5-methylcytosine-specific restriction endonuclease McrA